MQVEIKNYRGVSDAQLTMAPIALVAGPNGSGKTSISQAVAAALTKNAAPIDGIAKNAAGQLLRDGAKRGKCVVGDESGNVTANWPGASVSEEGTPPWASEIACGLVSLVDMKPKDAAALLIDAIEATPTLDDLTAALPDTDETLLGQVWAAIQKDGWEIAHKRSQERGTKLKGAWEQVTGERYGSQKAEAWKPSGTPEAGTEELKAELDGLRAELEAAIANQAVGEAEVQRLQAQIEAGTAAQASLVELQAHQEKGNAHADKLTAELGALPKPETVETLAECPHCKGHLVVVSTTDVRAPAEGGITAEENEQRQAAIDAKRAELLRTNNARTQIGGQIASAMQTISLATAAAAQLEALPKGGATAEQIKELRNDITDAETDLRSVQAAASAEKIHGDIGANQAVIEALAPTGVRQTVLNKKMGEFNAALARLSKSAGWGGVRIDEALGTYLGGRAYILLSESEKYRVRVTLQVALADLDGSEAVIVDAADILDRIGRNGLLKMLHASGMRSLVTMTMNTQADVPDLAKPGFGRSYWLADSVLAPVGA
jgi:hypothetical protein